jgi:hypothetical protein
VLEGLSNRLGVNRIRRVVQTKLAGTVDEVVRRHRAGQDELLNARFGDLERQFAEARHDLHQLVSHTLERVNELETRLRRDIVFAGEHHAAREASHFAREHMSGTTLFGHPHQTLEHGLSLAPTGGMTLEFGVASGTTLKIIATARNGERVFGFDSFKGLPADWRSGFPAGKFEVEEPPEVPGAELVIGLFDDTVPGFLAEHEGPVDFLHVDSDLYSSAKTVLDQVGPRLRVGSVVVFDEFFNYPAWREHEYLAWTEYVERTGISFAYRAYTWDNEQVVVQITDR